VFVVSPFRPLWWVGRRLLRLLICAAIAAAFWAGLQAAAQPEPTQITVMSAPLTVQDKSKAQSVPATDGAAMPAARSALPVTHYLAAPMRGKLSDGSDKDRAPPRR
jgi:hypothetical protein